MGCRSSYKAIFLDLDHTLCDTDAADRSGELFLEQLLHDNHVGSKAECELISRTFIELLYSGSSRVTRLSDEDEGNYRARLMQFSVESNSDCKLKLERSGNWVNAVMSHRIQSLNYFPGTISLMERLSLKYKLVLITNGPLYSQEPKVKKLEVEKFVDHLILCGAYPWQKPDVRIFQEALKVVNCSSHEVIHVGDSLKSDIQGANNAGVDSIWISASKQLLEPDQPQPTYIISHISDLEDVLHNS